VGWNWPVPAVEPRRPAAYGRLAALAPRGGVEVRVLVLLELLAAVACLGSFAVPTSRLEVVDLYLAVGLLCAATAAVLWLAGGRTGPATWAGVLACGVVLNSVFVATARTPQGKVLTTFPFVSMAVYAASFLPRLAVLAELALISAGCAAGLAANGLARWGVVWAVVAGTIVMTGLVLERAVGRLRRQADTDVLTGVLNRRGFQRVAELEQAIADRLERPLVLAVIDLDDFKLVNDVEGHEAGDRLLAEAARAWLAVLGADAVLGRLGGDEFAFVARAPLAGAERLLARLRAGHPIRFTAGVTELEPGEGLQAALRRADEQLYVRKLQRQPPASDQAARRGP